MGIITVNGCVGGAATATFDSVVSVAVCGCITVTSGTPMTDKSSSAVSYILTSTDTKYLGRSWGDKNLAISIISQWCRAGQSSGCSKYGSIPGKEIGRASC